MSAANIFQCDRIAKHVFHENCIRAMFTLLRDASYSDDLELFCPTISSVLSKGPPRISHDPILTEIKTARNSKDDFDSFRSLIFLLLQKVNIKSKL